MQMAPVMPEDGFLEDRVVELVKHCGRLSKAVHSVTRAQVVDLIRSLNSHYSNRIEGHDTHLRDIKEAMEKDFSNEPIKKEKQQLALAHIEVQALMEEKIKSGETSPVTSPDFLCWLHREFYERLPESMRWVENPDTGERKEVIPGKLREKPDEIVGARQHRGVNHQTVRSFMERFHEVYNPSGLTSVKAILAFAASHHRLLWIHPFLDGNGRVTRLFSHAYAMKVGIDAGGLWSISRGFARYIDDYQQALFEADRERQHDTDGRGHLSQLGLNSFCEFMLEVSIDQVEFMENILDLENLDKRIRGFAKKAADGLAPEIDAIHPETGRLLTELMYRGEIARGEVSEFFSVGDRQVRKIVKSLEENELVSSETPRGPVRLSFPEAVVRDYFPDLYSHDMAYLEESEALSG
jgi:Fic family protein